MHPEAKNVGTPNSRSLPRHSRHHHFCGFDKCDLGFLDVGHTIVLHLGSADAVIAKIRNWGSLCYGVIVSFDENFPRKPSVHLLMVRDVAPVSQV